MVPRCLFPWSVALLALVGLHSTTVSAAPIQFTGNVENDFNAANDLNTHNTPVSSNPLSIGQSSWITSQGWVSGWSLKDLRTNYDATTDTLYVGINNFKNPAGQIAPFGQANGDPSGAATPYDPGHFGGDKSVAMAIAPVSMTSPAQPGAPLVVAGVPADKTAVGAGTDGFTVSQYDPTRINSGLAYQFGQKLPQF